MSAMISGGKINTADQQLTPRISFTIPSRSFYRKSVEECLDEIGAMLLKEIYQRINNQTPLFEKKIKDCSILELLKAVRDKTE